MSHYVIGGKLENRVIRIRLKDDVFRKYKVYCAIANISVTEQTNMIIKKFVDDQQQIIKIINVSNNV